MLPVVSVLEVFIVKVVVLIAERTGKKLPKVIDLHDEFADTMGGFEGITAIPILTSSVGKGTLNVPKRGGVQLFLSFQSDETLPAQSYVSALTDLFCKPNTTNTNKK